MEFRVATDARGANVHIAYGAGITIQYVQNVIIHGLHIHDIVPGSGGMIRDSEDHFGFRTRSDGDGISIFGGVNIWIDHVSMSNCSDGLIDAIMGSTGITISNCHFTRHNEVAFSFHFQNQFCKLVFRKCLVNGFRNLFSENFLKENAFLKK